MTFYSRTPASWALHGKVGLVLALLVAHLAVQAAQHEPNATPEPNANARANADGPVVVSTDKAKEPKKHRETKRGPVKPERYPTQPQQVVKTLR